VAKFNNTVLKVEEFGHYKYDCQALLLGHAVINEKVCGSKIITPLYRYTIGRLPSIDTL
jgi:hypothetical protein